MTEQPEWLSKYDGDTAAMWAALLVQYPGIPWVVQVIVMYTAIENQRQADRIARLEAGQRELEARLGDDGE